MTDTKHEAPAEGAGELDRAIRRMRNQLVGSATFMQLMFGREDVRKVLDALEDLRDRSSAPQAREGEAVVWQHRFYSHEGEPGLWTECEPPEDPNNLRPARIIEYRRLYTHPAAPSADKLRFNPTHRHWARGTTYEVIGEARLQQAGQFGPVEGDSITVYRGEDGQLWCRAQSEFEDGRFENLSTPDALKGDAK